MVSLQSWIVIRLDLWNLQCERTASKATALFSMRVLAAAECSKFDWLCSLCFWLSTLSTPSEKVAISSGDASLAETWLTRMEKEVKKFCFTCSSAGHVTCDLTCGDFFCFVPILGPGRWAQRNLLQLRHQRLPLIPTLSTLPCCLLVYNGNSGTGVLRPGAKRATCAKQCLGDRRRK